MDGYIYKPPPPPPSVTYMDRGVRSSKPYWPPPQPSPPAPISAGVIPGLGIRVSTPEEIEKWISDRKRNWPSRQRVLQKEQAAQKQDPVHKRPSAADNAVCRYFDKGSCRHGAKCTFAHVRSSKYRRFEPPAPNSSLFKLLVQNDMKTENDQVLQFLVFLHANGQL